jgi:hypothetical protein
MNSTVQHNPNGKPRKGSFEVVLKLEKKDDSSQQQKRGEVVLYSKLDTYGPAKNRDHLPALLDVLALIRAELSPEGRLDVEVEEKLQAAPSPSSSGSNKKKRKISLNAEADEDATPKPEPADAAPGGEDKPAPKRLAKRTRRATTTAARTTASS